MDSQDYIRIEDRYGAHNYHPLDVVVERARGVWVWDVDGKKYMDCLAAYSAVNQGHCHPRIVAALKEQVELVTLTSRAFRNKVWPLFAQQVCELLGYEMVLPMNSGAEAVETAIKTSRKWGYKVKGIPPKQAEILVCSGNFHGRTTTVVSFSDDPSSFENYGPYTPGFKIIPYGDIAALEKAITRNTAAFLVEPIQGEAGVVVPPAGYLKQAAEICSKNNVLLVADEIQSGLGRTGKMLASEHEGVKPDMIVIGKALSGGLYPVSAVLSSRRILGVIEPGTHGSTYGGNPLACAVAREALKVLVEENLLDNASKQGNYFMEKLRALDTPHIDFVRGKGLWIGIVLKKESGGARRFCEALKEQGILAKDTHENVIRLAPPLVISRQEIDWAMERIERVFTSL
ncbi:MAG TPA: ornithine--oxo-acid transaminase [bacterium]|nr:ornithine--oxo-acid transaminase [bacterium]HNT66930.1 ornithine--oxo-acid transaminase [bacterium]HOX85971.1 ornithine--oxo-acid transaminase [bacterium]HPG45046.1 ornithine--oxo-acid transaminase [bacterium]HPM97288.1 ornithine--oxo-acid transaminase [bacterium]